MNMRKLILFLAINFLLLWSFSVHAAVLNVQDNYRFTYNIIDGSANHVTGQTVTLQIQRASDGYWLDFNDMAFKNTGWTSKTTNLAEDATNGVYYYVFNPPSSETNANQYIFLVDNNDSLYADHQSETVDYVNLSNQGAVLDELVSNHLTPGTVGKAISDIKDATDGDKESGNYTGIETMIRSQR